MTTFSYTTGNPSNLTGGATASMNDIQGPFTDLRTFLNGGNLDATNIAATYSPAIAAAYGEPLLRTSGIFAAGDVAATYILKADAPPPKSGTTDGGNSGHPMHVALAAAYAVAGVTTKLRIRAWVMTNATAPAINYTVGLHPITVVTGGAAVITITVGAAIAGSTVVLTAPGASSNPIPGTGSDFNYSALTDGIGYVLGVVTSGTVAANSYTSMGAALEMRRV